MMTQRCNEKMDCPDNSDEENCASIKLPPDYNLGVPPLGSSNNGELIVQISKFLLDIEDIRDVDGVMDLQFGIVSIWKDSRLTYINLNNDGPSVITSKEKNLIWLPSYTIWKTDSKGLQEEFGFQTLSAYALQNGTISDINNDVAYFGYPGIINPIINILAKYLQLDAVPLASRRLYTYIVREGAAKIAHLIQKHKSKNLWLKPSQD